MVKLQEVEDEHFTEKPESSKDNALLLSDDDDDDYTDTDSEISDVSSPEELQSHETIFDRIYALRDIVPPRTRSKINSGVSTLGSYAKGTWSFTSKSVWVLSTTMIFWGVPYGLALLQETELLEQEREQGMLREGGNMMLQSGEADAPGGIAPQGQQGARPAL
ncbi:putative mitochondrial import receptor subunit tom22 [Phaeomoniella chlamydospora]|uniref:Putative mitochondrial import receptor subunit tom22 n=1 Tax=Phaeomoniella chlamydospora TaxID=158046 RepID=A0A0G2EFU5_PHACM|nr:putative mitochondrial import receptor subunit tom22 [Phaeomoniella chlamydospora]